jgi:hypothetical protein
VLAPTQELDLDRLRRDLREGGPEERRAACRVIAASTGEARVEGVRLLVAERRGWLSRLRRAARRVDGLVVAYDRHLASRSERVAGWEAAARAALEAIFDEQLFPTPVGPIHGPYEGYDQVMARVEVAVELYEDLRRQAHRDLRKVLRLDRDEAAGMLDQLERPAAYAVELGDALVAMGEEAEPAPSPGLLPLAVLRLVAGDWRGVAALDVTAPLTDGRPRPACQEGWFPAPSAAPADPTGAGPAPRPRGRLEGYERFLFHHALGELVEEGNARAELDDVSADGREAVAVLNRYRRALGVRPLQLHPALVRAIRDHLWTLRELSHEGATPETRTAAQRIAVAGYPASHATGENLSDSDVVTAMGHWRWDGGHHRILVHPCMVHVGVFQGAFSGMLVAAGDVPRLPALPPLTFDL